MSGISPAPFKLTDAGIAAVLSSATVATKMAGVAVGDIGSFAFLYGADSAPVNPGDTVPGSFLKYSGSNSSSSTINPAGTWKCCGYESGTNATTLWQRVA